MTYPADRPNYNSPWSWRLYQVWVDLEAAVGYQLQPQLLSDAAGWQLHDQVNARIDDTRAALVTAAEKLHA